MHFIYVWFYNGVVSPETPEAFICEKRHVWHGNPGLINIGTFLEFNFRQLPNKSKYGIRVGENVPAKYFPIRLERS